MERGWAELGQAIRRHRISAALSQEKLAERSGLHWTYISEIETNKRSPGINVLRKIAAGLDIRLSQLVAEAEEMSTAKGERVEGGR